MSDSEDNTIWDLADIFTAPGYWPDPRIENRSEKYIWNKHHILRRCAAFYSKINENFKEGLYTDVNIVCGDRVFECHKQILAAASEYFHCMFCGNFKECHTQDVILRDIDSTTFELILLFAYTGKIGAIDDDNVFNLLRASDIFRLKDIEEFCVHYLTQKRIPWDDALEIYLYAVATNNVSLISAVIQFIRQHLDRFCQEGEFLRLSSDNFSTLLSYFHALSATQITRLLDAILQWVQYSTDFSEDIRSSFMNMALRLDCVRETDIEDYFNRKMSNNNVNDECSGEMSVDSDLGSDVKINVNRLIAYVQECSTAGFADRTSIFSLQTIGDEAPIRCSLDQTIQPSIYGMKVVELAGKLYSFKTHTASEPQWTFSASTAFDLSTDEQFLALPSGLYSIQSDDFFDGSASLCRFQKNLYMYYGSPWFNSFQCYSAELDSWFPIPTVSALFKPQNLISDDTRLYALGTYPDDSTSYYRLLAYDPRIRNMEELSSLKVSHEFASTERGTYHRGRIYFPSVNMPSRKYNIFYMAIYDPVAGRWDAQKLDEMSPTVRDRRLVSFNDRLWLFGFKKRYMTAVTYNSYLQEWDWETCSRQEINYAPGVIINDFHRVKWIMDAVTF